jgi:hypothetical protein
MVDVVGVGVDCFVDELTFFFSRLMVSDGDPNESAALMLLGGDANDLALLLLGGDRNEKELTESESEETDLLSSSSDSGGSTL